MKDNKKTSKSLLVVFMVLFFMAGVITGYYFIRQLKKNNNTNYNPYIIGDMMEFSFYDHFREITSDNDIELHEKLGNIKINKMYILYPNECVENIVYYYLTDNGIFTYYYDMVEGPADEEFVNTYNINNLKLVSKNNKIKSLELIFNGVEECVFDYNILGVSDSKELYSLESNKKYGIAEVDPYYGRIIGSTNNIAIISDDNEIYINGKKTNYLYKSGFAVDGQSYIITEDNYLYDINNNKLYNKSKIKSINSLDPEGPMSKYTIIFEGGKDFTFLTF